MAFLVIALLAGCATAVPFNDCLSEPVCEAKAIRREDMRFKRDMIEQERRQCVMPRIWDDRSRQCKTGDTMIW